MLAAWTDSGARIRWYSAWLDGNQPLYVFLFEFSLNPGVVLLHATSHAGRQLVLRRLSEADPDVFVRDQNLHDNAVADVTLVVQHVSAMRWFLDLRSGRMPPPVWRTAP